MSLISLMFIFACSHKWKQLCAIIGWKGPEPEKKTQQTHIQPTYMNGCRDCPNPSFQLHKFTGTVKDNRHAFLVSIQAASLFPTLKWTWKTRKTFLFLNTKRKRKKKERRQSTAKSSSRLLCVGGTLETTVDWLQIETLKYYINVVVNTFSRHLTS